MQAIINETIVIIPAFQAEKTIEAVVKPLKELGLKVLVINDASSDQTAVRAQGSGARVISLSQNGGKGNALRVGLTVALQEGFSWMLTMDSDGQHLPEEVPRFLEAVCTMEADVIIGNRMSNPAQMPWLRKLTNRQMSRMLSQLAGQTVPDTQCGFRMIARRVLERLHLATDRFEIESELIVKGARSGFQIVSIPISSVYGASSSHIHPVRDTVRFFQFLRACKKEEQALI